MKIRGFRVELGEIEAAIAAEPGVAAVAVALRPLAGIEQLVAFVTAANGDAPSPSRLRKVLGERLPKYMVPAYFEFLSELPRLTSGKVDRKALSDLPLTVAVKDNHDEEAGPQSIRPAKQRNDDGRAADEEVLYAALGQLFPGQPLCGELDFFDDLGGHSLLVARLVSTLRADRHYATLSIQDIYRQPRLHQIAARLQHLRQKRCNEEQVANLPDMGQIGNLHHVHPRIPVPRIRRWLCGAVQTLVIPGLMLLHISSWLFPFFVYHYFTGDPGDSILLATVYSVLAFLLVEVGLFPVAIAGKWLVAGRLKPGRYPLWGATYFRWWLADRLCELPRVDLLSGTPLLCWFLRALGAKIGSDVIIDSVYLRSPDLLTIESGACIGTAVHVGNAGVERGMLVLGPVHVGREAAVDSYAVLQNDTSVGNNARLGGLSALPARQSVPDGENWEGSPARRSRSGLRTAAAAAPRRPPGAAGRVGVLHRRRHGGGRLHSS